MWQKIGTLKCLLSQLIHPTVVLTFCWRFLRHQQFIPTRLPIWEEAELLSSALANKKLNSKQLECLGYRQKLLKKKLGIKLSYGSTVVGHSTTEPVIEGSNLASSMQRKQVWLGTNF